MFYSDTCPSCKSMRTYFETVRNQNQESRLQFITVNISTLPDLSQKLSVRSVPTFIAFHDGVAGRRFTGAYRDELDRMVEKNKAMMATK